MQCSKCRRDAVIFQRYSGLHLCEQHFNCDFEAKAKRAIGSTADRVRRWVAVRSGGKDSSAVLFFLHRLLHNAGRQADGDNRGRGSRYRDPTGPGLSPTVSVFPG